MISKIIAGKFDAEKDWDAGDTAKLPAISSTYYSNIVLAMDELLVAYSTSKKDIVLTKNSIDPEQLNYFTSLGIYCQNQTYENICKSDFASKTLDTYAVTPEYVSFAEENGLAYEHPEIEVVSRANSKIYSVELSRRCALNNYSVQVNDYEELEYWLKEMINTYGQVMIKEDYGVSGKGNTVIEEKKVERFLHNIKRQEEKGKSVKFILEPRFEVEKDFSSQWFITKEGKVNYISIQEIRNHGSAYGGSIDLEDDTLIFLHKENYFEKMKTICDGLFRDGYYGDVCVDSMIVKEHGLIPVVEINARKSMSLTKHAFDKTFEKNAVKNNVSYMSSSEVYYNSETTFGGILQSLNRYGIEYNTNNKSGVIPLTGSTLFSNRDKDKELSRGRIYFYVTAKEVKDVENILKRMAAIEVYGRS